jgi:hypothetical protein
MLLAQTASYVRLVPCSFSCVFAGMHLLFCGCC